MTPDYEKLARRPPPTLPLDRRIGIAEVEKVYPEPGARGAGRSLPEMPHQPGFQRRQVHSLRRLRGRLPGELSAPGGCLRDLRGDEKLQAALLARYGRVPAARRTGGDHQRRDPLHPLRPVRRALSDRRDHDGTRRIGAGVI